MAIGPVPAERRIITILAADIADSTSHIATADPDDAQALFDRWFEHFQAVVEQAGGKLVSYEGDGGIAVFGWPAALEDHADRACMAAWDIQQTSNNSLGPDGRPVRFRVGVHAGLAALRQVDREGRSLFNTVGATVNIAAKLQQAAPAGGVLLSEQVVKLCRSELTLVPYEATPALRTIGIAAFSLERRPDAARGGDISRRYSLPMVGRQAELALLREALPRGRASGRSIALIGEPGIGKSRLAAALFADTRALDLKKLVYFGDGQKRTTPFAAARGLIRTMLGEDVAESHEATTAALAVIGLAAEDAAAIEALLAAPEAAREKRARRLERTTKLTQLQLTRALVNGFRALALDRPTVLLVEDLHLIDPESCQFLRLLAETEGGEPLTVVLTGRPEALPQAREAARRVIRLEALPAADMRDMALQLWPLDRPPPEVLDRVVARAEGIPFVLEEMVRSVEGRDPSSFQALPQSVESVIHARLQRLSPGAKTVAQTLSLLGEDVDVAFAAEVLGLEQDVLTRRLAELERFAFIHPVSRQSTHMRHQIIAEACADTIPRERRRQVHGAVVQALTARHASLGGRYEQLAFHAEGAGDDLAALGFLWEAALEARRNSAAASLNLIFDRAVTLAGRIGEAAQELYVDFVLMAFAAMVQLGEFDKVNLHLPRVMDLVRLRGRPERVSSTLSHLGMICWFEGRYEEGLRATEEGIAIARQLGSAALIYSNQIMQTNILHDMGQVERAIAEEHELCEMLSGDLEAARLGASGIPRATALAFMSWYLVDVGRYDEGLDYARRAFEVAIREQDIYGELLARNALGRNLLLLCRDEEAAECLMIGRALSEREGYDAIQPNLIGRAAHALARVGRSPEAIAMVETCLAQGLHLRTGQMEVFNLTAGYGEALFRGGDVERGLARLAEALAVARRINNPCLLVDGLGLRARLLAGATPTDPRIAEDRAERDDLCRRHGLARWEPAGSH